MSAAGAKAVHAEPNATPQDWIAVIAGALGALIATLDISIVNSALPQIQGEIGATGTEGTWIATGYLVSEVVMIPLTAWLSRMLGMRTLLLTCAVLFTVFSVMCGASHDLSTMVIGRVGQGFFGGALIPTAQTIVRTRLPQHQIPIGMTMFGLIVLLGPLMGPVLGGWLTENGSWQWCFFINIPVAVGLVSLLLIGVPHQKANIHELVEADWPGIIGMSIGLSCLTIVLEEGQRDQWFDSQLIRTLSIFAVMGLTTLGITQFTSKRPVLKLKLLKNYTYASVILIVVTIGMVLYNILYVLPQFLSGVAGYNAFQSGLDSGPFGPAGLRTHAGAAADPADGKREAGGRLRAGVLRHQLLHRHPSHRPVQRPRLHRLAAAARRRPDLLLHAAEPDLGRRGRPLGNRRCGGAVQHGAQSRRHHRTCAAGRVHRPAYRSACRRHTRVGERQFNHAAGSTRPAGSLFCRSVRRCRHGTENGRSPPWPGRSTSRPWS